MTFTECQNEEEIYMKKKPEIKLPKGKFSTMYYCGDCRHLDRRDVTKDGEAAYCKLHRTYRCFDKDYGCSDWER
jgi:hypothetical protein